MITIRDEGSLPRLDADGKLVAKRSLSAQPEGINLLDCLGNQRIRLPLELDGLQDNGVVEVWASLSGQDCVVATSRTGPARTCWKVADAVPLAPTVDVDIPVQSILGGAAPFSPTTTAANADACGKVDHVAVGVQVLYFAPGNTSTAAEARTIMIEADTRPPERPAAPRVARDPVPSMVRVSSEPTAVGGGVRVYCKKLDDQSGDVCPVLAYGIPLAGYTVDAEFEREYACDDGIPTDGESAVLRSTAERRFEEGGRYAFLLTRVDTFGNASTVSDATCESFDAVAAPAADDGGCNAAGHDPISPALVAVALVVATGIRRRLLT